MDRSTDEIRSALTDNEQTSAAERAREYLEKLENTPLNIAVTGETGSGLSCLVNALRGLDNRHKDATPIGRVETTIEVTGYPHPDHPNVTIWDLPGVGTTKFPTAKYLKHVGFKKYDFFIIVSSGRFRENDAQLSKEIQKMNKKFYFVRSQMDHNMRDEARSQKDFDEEKSLKRIRDNCIKELQRLGIESPKVFLVSNFELHLYDFENLCQTLQRDLPEHKRDVLRHGLPVSSLTVLKEKIKGITMDTGLDEIKSALQNNEQTAAAERSREYLEKLENTPLNIAVTGEAGSGKSSFVNALRGLDNRHEDAAPTGCVETTIEVTGYPHPDHPNIIISDLPGISTTKFPAAKYLKHVGFKKYDFFIIVSSDRFRENDAKLAKEIQKMKKKFYFVRSKMDHSMRDEAEDQKDFDEEKSLKRIRDNCIQELQKLGMESPQVFLVSSRKLGKYDFEELRETIQRDLPEHKRDVLLHGLPVTSLKALEKKIKRLETFRHVYAVGSAAGAAVPIPGVSIAADIALIVGFVVMCQTSLGLTKGAVQRLSEATGVSVEDIRAELRSPFTGVEVTQELVMTSLKWCVSAMIGMALEEGSRFIPILGIPIAMGLSYFTIYSVLKKFLKPMAEDARRVFAKVLTKPPSV